MGEARSYSSHVIAVDHTLMQHLEIGLEKEITEDRSQMRSVEEVLLLLQTIFSLNGESGFVEALLHLCILAFALSKHVLFDSQELLDLCN